MTISKKSRFEIFERDNFTCQYCGRKSPIVILELDHIIPKSKDGSDEPTNLITSCRKCNQGKSTMILKDKILRVKRLQAEKQQQRQAFDKFLQQQKEKEEKTLDELNNYWSTSSGNSYSLNENGLRSLRRFLKFFSKEEIKDAIEIASSKIALGTDDDIEHRFKYMCGVLHNRKREKENPGLWEIIKYWTVQSGKIGRGIGFYKENCLIDALARHTMIEIKEAIDEALSERRSSYFRTLCQILNLRY